MGLKEGNFNFLGVLMPSSIERSRCLKIADGEHIYGVSDIVVLMLVEDTQGRMSMGLRQF